MRQYTLNAFIRKLEIIKQSSWWTNGNIEIKALGYDSSESLPFLTGEKDVIQSNIDEAKITYMEDELGLHSIYVSNEEEFIILLDKFKTLNNMIKLIITIDSDGMQYVINDIPIEIDMSSYDYSRIIQNIKNIKLLYAELKLYSFKVYDDNPIRLYMDRFLEAANTYIMENK